MINYRLIAAVLASLSALLGCSSNTPSCNHAKQNEALSDSDKNWNEIQIDRVSEPVRKLVERAKESTLVGATVEELHDVISLASDRRIDLPHDREIFVFYLPDRMSKTEAKETRLVLWFSACNRCNNVTECHLHREPLF
jgi:hypothetical protein